MIKKILIITSLFLFYIKAHSQDLPNLTPLSPNAAEITKYGEIPVGYFTGVPNISIPIYTINTRELNLPLTLSYHAGGNRVESIASWVGLGWSLGTIPSISRSVRGIPDENGGYFSKYGGQYTVEELWNLGSGNTYNEFKNFLFDGSADSEPDIFSYSLPEESGKFFYNQEIEAFITFPKSNIKITRNNDVFTLVTQNGVEYTFNIIEKSASNGAVEGDLINSTWYASTIKSASKRDVIRLTYLQENQIHRTKNVTTKYHWLSSSNPNVGTPTLPNDGSILNINIINAMVVDSIIFDNGYVKFNKNTGAYRTDLNGGYSLNNISVYNNHNQLVSKHEFTYRYKLGGANGGLGSACYGADSDSKTWMLLDKVDHVSSLNPSEKLPYYFTYNEAFFPACRYSAAQDYWGYYNGNESNKDLTPPYYLPVIDWNTQMSGADRGVDPTKSKFGILTKITYPTGGYTEFDFENNTAFVNDLPLQYVAEQQMMAGDEYFDPEVTPDGTDIFQKTFTINNPPDKYLNNNNQNGGGTVNFQFYNPGCDLSSGNANPCARFTVSGTSINTTDITIEGKFMYLPNGTYTMTASFDQPYPNTNYQDFIFTAEWQKIDPNQDENKYSGGLRIKEIRSFTNSSAQPIIKKYKYTVDYESTTSSGDIFSIPNFSHENIINYDYYVYDVRLNAHHLNQIEYFRIRSTSNVQQVTHSGSYVGYSKVFEETDNASETGYTEYEFGNIRDKSQGYNFPYPPDESMELERGQLLFQTDYKKNGTEFELAQKKSLLYSSLAFDNATEYPKSSFAIKWGNLLLSNYNMPTYDYAQNMTSYKVFSRWNGLLSESNTSYFENGTNLTSTLYDYDNPLHLLKTGTKTTSSDNKSIHTKTKYPQDITNPSSAILGLINQNRLGEALETKSYKDINNNGILDSNELLNTQYNDYHQWTQDIILPEFIQTSTGSNALENRIVYHNYDDWGNPIEISKADGTSIVYIWGYNGQYPIAKIENATYSEISSQVANLQNLSDADDSVADENTLRTALNNLRNTPALSDALVTTYTYDPLVGVTSITDPSGLTSYFDYDEFNRLKEVKNRDGNIVNHYNYHYKGQQ